MPRRILLLTLAAGLAAVASLAQPAYLPLDPATLGGAAIFTDAETRVARAAASLGLAFAADPRPLPPQVLLTFDHPDGTIRQRQGILVWRGDMLPDQLAPGETGTLIRRRLADGGQWKTVRRKPDCPPLPPPPLAPADRLDAPVPLPAMIIETPYHLGTAGNATATLVLWRTPEEGRPPLGGALLLADPSPELLRALETQIPPFAGQDSWAGEFRARAP